VGSSAAALHKTNWAIKDRHSNPSWWAMEGHYDPQFTIDIDYLFLAALRLRFDDYKHVLATDNGDYCFFPSVLCASAHFPTKYLFSVEDNHQVGCGLGQALIAHRNV